MSAHPLLKPTPLPVVAPMRWTPRRKQEVVAMVISGRMTLGEAQTRYALSAEEFLGWHKRAWLDAKGEGVPGWALVGGALALAASLIWSVAT